MPGGAAPRAGRGPTERSCAKAIAALRAVTVNSPRLRELSAAPTARSSPAIASAIRSQCMTEMVAAALNNSYTQV